MQSILGAEKENRDEVHVSATMLLLFLFHQAEEEKAQGRYKIYCELRCRRPQEPISSRSGTNELQPS